MNRFFKKFISTGLACAFFVTHVLLAHALETNIWDERRLARKAQTDNRPTLASLPVNFPPIQSALTALPAWGPREQKRFGPLSQAVLELAQAVPQNQGKIQAVFDAKNTEHPPILILQDVHMNVEAQGNLAGILLSMIDDDRVGLVGVEGAFSTFNFAPFRSLSDQQISRKVAKSFLDENELAAPSFAGIASLKDPPPFIGIDDRKHYDANVQAFLSTRAIKKRVKNEISEKKRTLNEKKKETFSPDLKRFDDLKEAYEAGTMGLGAYASSIFTQPTEGPLRRFLEAYHLEKSLDFPKVERERRQVIEKVAPLLRPAEMENLMRQSLAYRTGRLGFGAYYQELKELFDQKGIDLAKTQEFSNYIRYVLLSDGIDAPSLFEDLKKQEEAVVSQLTRSPDEKILMAQSEQLRLSEKLIEFSLTPDEWATYIANESRDPSLTAFEAFYQEADIRSQHMLTNLLRETKNTGSTPVALVMGGFHTPAITALLSENKISYVVASPNISKIDSAAGSDYLNVFAREKTPLDKLFQGEKLFLAPEEMNITWAAKTFQMVAIMMAFIGNSSDVKVPMGNDIVEAHVILDQKEPTRASVTLPFSATWGIWGRALKSMGVKKTLARNRIAVNLISWSAEPSIIFIFFTGIRFLLSLSGDLSPEATGVLAAVFSESIFTIMHIISGVYVWDAPQQRFIRMKIWDSRVSARVKAWAILRLIVLGLIFHGPFYLTSSVGAVAWAMGSHFIYIRLIQKKWFPKFDTGTRTLTWDDLVEAGRQRRGEGLDSNDAERLTKIREMFKTISGGNSTALKELNAAFESMAGLLATQPRVYDKFLHSSQVGHNSLFNFLLSFEGLSQDSEKIIIEALNTARVELEEGLDQREWWGLWSDLGQAIRIADGNLNVFHSISSDYGRLRKADKADQVDRLYTYRKEVEILHKNTLQAPDGESHTWLLTDSLPLAMDLFDAGHRQPHEFLALFRLLAEQGQYQRSEVMELARLVLELMKLSVKNKHEINWASGLIESVKKQPRWKLKDSLSLALSLSEKGIDPADLFDYLFKQILLNYPPDKDSFNQMLSIVGDLYAHPNENIARSYLRDLFRHCGNSNEFPAERIGIYTSTLVLIKKMESRGIVPGSAVRGIVESLSEAKEAHDFHLLTESISLADRLVDKNINPTDLFGRINGNQLRSIFSISNKDSSVFDRLTTAFERLITTCGQVITSRNLPFRYYSYEGRLPLLIDLYELVFHQIAAGVEHAQGAMNGPFLLQAALGEADDNIEAIYYFLTEKRFEPNRLHGIFDVYFNSTATADSIGKKIDNYGINQKGKNKNPGAYYKSMDEGFKKLHRQQKRKLEYQFLIPFMKNFVEAETIIRPEAEFFFKLLTAKNNSRDWEKIKMQLWGNMNLLDENHSEQSTFMVHLGLRVLEYKWGLKEMSVERLGQECVNIAREFNDWIELSTYTSDLGSIWIDNFIRDVESAINPVETESPSSKGLKKPASIDEVLKGAREYYKSKKIKIFHSLLPQDVPQSAGQKQAEIKALEFYDDNSALNQEGKSVIDSAHQLVKSNPNWREVLQTIKIALRKVLGGEFKQWRYQSPDYLKTLDQLKLGENRLHKLAEKKSRWEENQSFEVTGSNGRKQLLGFTDDFSVLINIGNPVNFKSCQACNKPGFNRGLLGTLSNGWNKVIVVFDENKNMVARRIIRLRVTKDGEPVLLREPIYGDPSYSPLMDRMLAKVAHDMGIRYESDNSNATEEIIIRLWKGHSEWDYSDIYGKKLLDESAPAGLVRTNDNQELEAPLIVGLINSKVQDMGGEAISIKEKDFLTDAFFHRDAGNSVDHIHLYSTSASILTPLPFLQRLKKSSHFWDRVFYGVFTTIGAGLWETGAFQMWLSPSSSSFAIIGVAVLFSAAHFIVKWLVRAGRVGWKTKSFGNFFTMLARSVKQDFTIQSAFRAGALLTLSLVFSLPFLGLSWMPSVINNNPFAFAVGLHALYNTRNLYTQGAVDILHRIRMQVMTAVSNSDTARAENAFWRNLAELFFPANVRVQFQEKTSVDPQLRIVTLNRFWILESSNPLFNLFRGLFFPIVLTIAEWKLGRVPPWVLYAFTPAIFVAAQIKLFQLNRYPIEEFRDKFPSWRRDTPAINQSIQLPPAEKARYIRAQRVFQDDQGITYLTSEQLDVLLAHSEPKQKKMILEKVLSVPTSEVVGRKAFEYFREFLENEFNGDFNDFNDRLTLLKTALTAIRKYGVTSSFLETIKMCIEKERMRDFEQGIQIAAESGIDALIQNIEDTDPYELSPGNIVISAHGILLVIALNSSVAPAISSEALKIILSASGQGDLISDLTEAVASNNPILLPIVLKEYFDTKKFPSVGVQYEGRTLTAPILIEMISSQRRFRKRGYLTSYLQGLDLVASAGTSFPLQNYPVDPTVAKARSYEGTKSLSTPQLLGLPGLSGHLAIHKTKNDARLLEAILQSGYIISREAFEAINDRNILEQLLAAGKVSPLGRSEFVHFSIDNPIHALDSSYAVVYPVEILMENQGYVLGPLELSDWAVGGFSADYEHASHRIPISNGIILIPQAEQGMWETFFNGLEAKLPGWKRPNKILYYNGAFADGMMELRRQFPSSVPNHLELVPAVTVSETPHEIRKIRSGRFSGLPLRGIKHVEDVNGIIHYNQATNLDRLIEVQDFSRQLENLAETVLLEDVKVFNIEEVSDTGSSKRGTYQQRHKQFPDDFDLMVKINGDLPTDVQIADFAGAFSKAIEEKEWLHTIFGNEANYKVRTETGDNGIFIRPIPGGGHLVKFMVESVNTSDDGGSPYGKNPVILVIDVVFFNNEELSDGLRYQKKMDGVYKDGQLIQPGYLDIILKNIVNPAEREEGRQQILRTIRNLKALFKNNGVYRRFENGLRGVGTEQLVVQLNGITDNFGKPVPVQDIIKLRKIFTLENALQSIENAMFDERGNAVSLAQFHENLPIWDPGALVPTRLSENINDNSAFKLLDITWQASELNGASGGLMLWLRTSVLALFPWIPSSFYDVIMAPVLENVLVGTLAPVLNIDPWVLFVALHLVDLLFFPANLNGVIAALLAGGNAYLGLSPLAWQSILSHSLVNAVDPVVNLTRSKLPTNSNLLALITPNALPIGLAEFGNPRKNKTRKWTAGISDAADLMAALALANGETARIEDTTLLVFKGSTWQQDDFKTEKIRIMAALLKTGSAPKEILMDEAARPVVHDALYTLQRYRMWRGSLPKVGQISNDEMRDLTVAKLLANMGYQRPSTLVVPKSMDVSGDIPEGINIKILEDFVPISKQITSFGDVFRLIAQSA